MTKSTNNRIRLGLLVTLSLAMLLGGIYFIGQRQQLFSATFRISGIFKDIDGLVVGNNVRFSGINVGVIEAISQITDSTVRVDMLVNENSRKYMRKSAIATIGSDGLMGNKIMILSSGTSGGAGLSPNDVIQTSRPVSMDDILVKIKVTADNAAIITNDLSIVMETIREGKGTVGKLLMDSAFAQNIDGAVFNIRQGAGGFKQNMDAASHNFLLRGFRKKKQN